MMSVLPDYLSCCISKDSGLHDAAARDQLPVPKMRPRLSGKEYRLLSKKPSGRRKKLKRRFMTCYLISKSAWENDDNNVWNKQQLKFVCCLCIRDCQLLMM